MPQPEDVHFGGLAGPSHHFGGLSHGNLASTAHAGHHSRPRAAAHQCLAAMRAVLATGRTVAVLPPLARPDHALLAGCGFVGATALADAAREAPRLLRWAWSSAAMWTANAATVGPGSDSDGTTRLVVANLAATPHRAREAAPRTRMLRRLLSGVPRLVVLDALPTFGDEGAANHARLYDDQRALHLFVHGCDAELSAEQLPQRFPARQQREASRAVLRLLQLDPACCVEARQHPAAIDAGAFHNDVVMIGDGRRLLLHELALVDQPEVLATLKQRLPGLRVRVVREDELPLAEAVASYLFNSQLLGDVMVAPQQCAHGRAAALLQNLCEEGFICEVRRLDLGESMANGGGPACLRLRVPLDAVQCAALPRGLVITEPRLAELAAWIDRHYRATLSWDDLASEKLVAEHAAACAELEILLGLPGLYAS